MLTTGLFPFSLKPSSMLYARNAGQSRYPNLWRGSAQFYCPNLGQRFGLESSGRAELPDYGHARNLITDTSSNANDYEMGPKGWQYDANNSAYTEDVHLPNPNEYTILHWLLWGPTLNNQLQIQFDASNDFYFLRAPDSDIQIRSQDTGGSNKDTLTTVTEGEIYVIISRMEHTKSATRYDFIRGDGFYSESSVATGSNGFSKAGWSSYKFTNSDTRLLAMYEWDALLTDAEIQLLLKNPLAPFELAPLPVITVSGSSGTTLVCNAGSIVITGTDATFSVAGGSSTLNCESGSVVITGTDANLIPPAGDNAPFSPSAGFNIFGKHEF